MMMATRVLVDAEYEGMEQEFIEIAGISHRVGDIDCGEGWCGRASAFSCKCGGLIHAEFGDENSNGDYWLHEMCDKCGTAFEKVE